MKTKCKKILCILLVFLTLFNFIFIRDSYATSESEKNKSGGTSAGDVVGAAIDGVSGIILMPAKYFMLILGSGFRAISSEAAEIGATSGEVWLLSLKDIFFHNVKVNGNGDYSAKGEKGLPILDVNFFDDHDDTLVGGIRNNIAAWYYSIRNLAIVLSLLILIYIGIRMAISTLAEDKVKYKKMLVDWIVGFVTIFLLHYIIIATIYSNEALVTALYKNAGAGKWSFISTYEENILIDAVGTAYLTTGMTNAIVYVGMAVMGVMFVYTYIKRMLTVAFLILIAPIITVTYSIDKVGDRKISSIKYMVKRIYI